LALSSAAPSKAFFFPFFFYKTVFSVKGNKKKYYSF